MRRAAFAYGILGAGMMPVPLLNVLHVESAALVALVAFFVSGWAALRAFERDASLGSVWKRQTALLGIPLAFLTVSMLWAPNCAYLTGLGVYLLFPGITVAFAVALASVIDATGWRHPYGGLGGMGLLIAVLGPIYDLGFHPQFYTYNHVFGGVLGPIYDEQLAFRPGLFVFRGLTLLWAGLAVLVGRRLRGHVHPFVRAGIPLVALLIGGVYFFSAELGFNTPMWYVKEQLGGHVRTEHVDVYYDATAMDATVARDLADDHEYQYRRLAERLDLAPSERPGRVQSFIYPTPDVKAHFTGARRTSVAPVWLAEPQIHLLRSRVSSTLDHELAHLMARPFGLPLLKASWAVGLVEGWAVALEAPSSAPTPDDLVLAAATADTTHGLFRRAEALADRLSPLGFWTGRGAVSYSTMGSFVQFLLDRYGAEPLKRVYAHADFASVYGVPVDTLAHAWAHHLQRRPFVHRSAQNVVSAVFTRPSLFEMRCPHYLPPHRRRIQEAVRALRQQDTTRAVRALHAALEARPQSIDAHVRLAGIRLARGEAAAVHRQLDTLSVGSASAPLLWRRADALVLMGDTAAARDTYARILDRLPAYRWSARSRVMLRDAVAYRPEVVRVLVGGDSADVQARQLADLSPQTPAVRAWRALRLQRARDPANAVRLWKRVGDPLRVRRPPLWHRTWTLQQQMWTAEAALRAKAFSVARIHAREAGRLARRYGDVGTERRMGALLQRVEWQAPPGSGRGG